MCKVFTPNLVFDKNARNPLLVLLVPICVKVPDDPAITTGTVLDKNLAPSPVRFCKSTTVPSEWVILKSTTSVVASLVYSLTSVVAVKVMAWDVWPTNVGLKKSPVSKAMSVFVLP